LLVSSIAVTHDGGGVLVVRRQRQRLPVGGRRQLRQHGQPAV